MERERGEGGGRLALKTCFDVALFPASHFLCQKQNQLAVAFEQPELNLTLFKLRERGNGPRNQEHSNLENECEDEKDSCVTSSRHGRLSGHFTSGSRRRAYLDYVTEIYTA